ncbi:MAG TPA: TonB-dependent receptor [Bacteroidota bacterium]|nr:TonB-dependent receptor [Bacteroidota bacterium]
MRKRIHYLPLFLLSLTTTFSQPQKTDSTKVYYEEPVVVTGTREGLSRKYVPASVTVVSSSELQSSGQLSLLDAVSEQVPDLFVSRRGVIGYGIDNPAGTISIRGLGGSPDTKVLVMIDGVPQFMGLYGHPLPDSYLSQDATRVEIIRGPASMLYGTNAMGGVINVITKKQEEEGWDYYGGTTNGSYNTQEYSLGTGYKDGRYNILVSGEHDQTDGHRPYSSFNTNDGYLNAGDKLNENLDLHLTGAVNKFRTYDPGPASAPLINTWYDVLRSTSSLSLDDKFAETDGSLKLFYNYGHHLIAGGFHSDDRNLGGVAYQNFRTSESDVVTVGADLQHYGGSAVDAATDYGRYYIDETGVYAMVEHFFLEHFMADAGARFVHNSVFGNQIVPSAGISWAANSQTTLKASVAKGYRNPSIGELYMFLPVENANLKPEDMWNYEIGLIETVSDQLGFDLTGFTANGTNLILVEGVYPNIQFTNSGTFRHKGIEFAGHYRPLTSLRIDANYSYVEPGEQTYTTPKHKAYIGLNYVYERTTVNLSMQHVAVLYGADGSQEPLPDYSCLDARISYQAFDFATIYLSGDNLLNSSYQTIFDYPMPGRTLFAGINCALR